MFLLWVFSIRICDRGDSDAWLNSLYRLQRLHFRPKANCSVDSWSQSSQDMKYIQLQHEQTTEKDETRPKRMAIPRFLRVRGGFVWREWRVLMNILAVVDHAN